MANSVIALIGNNQVIVNDETRSLVAELLEGNDPGMSLEEFTVNDDAISADERETFLQRVVNALNTPPFIVDRRVVVVRNAYALTKAATAVFESWMNSPTPGVTLLLSGTASKAPALTKLADRVVDVSVGYNKEEAYLRGKFKEYHLSAEPAVFAAILDRIGEEVERVDALARTLQSVFGSHKFSATDVEPYLGEMGNVPEWDLTDAVDKGRTSEALTTLRRMIESEGRVPVQIVGILQRHYLRLSQLHNSGAATTSAVMGLLGLKEYPAKKLLGTFNSLGSDRVAQAVHLVAQADVDLKGATALEPEITLEILVARLSRLSATSHR